MPPKCKFKKEEIVQAAFDLAREKGISAVTARAIGAKLKSSSKVIFSLFENMEQLHKEVYTSAYKLYQSYLQQDMAEGKYHPYKASGMAYIRFAKTEKELFKWLFMRNRSNETTDEDGDEVEPLLDIIKQTLGLDEEKAYLFHLEMWIYVHGIATMTATSYLDWDEDFISKVITDAYMGLKYRYTQATDD